MARNNVYDCHLSPVRRQMSIENSVLIVFWSTCVNCINVFDCRLSGGWLLIGNIRAHIGNPLCTFQEHLPIRTKIVSIKGVDQDWIQEQIMSIKIDYKNTIWTSSQDNLILLHKSDKGTEQFGITAVGSAHWSHDMWFPTMWHFNKCKLRRACAASF